MFTSKLNPQTHMNLKKTYILELFWNLFRPYAKCRCWASKYAQCKAGIMWMDHLIWYMINHAMDFFPLSFAQASIFACITWLNSLPHDLKQAIIIYYNIHKCMIDKAKCLCDPLIPVPPILDSTPLDNLIT